MTVPFHLYNPQQNLAWHHSWKNLLRKCLLSEYRYLTTLQQGLFGDSTTERTHNWKKKKKVADTTV